MILRFGLPVNIPYQIPFREIERKKMLLWEKKKSQNVRIHVMVGVKIILWYLVII